MTSSLTASQATVLEQARQRIAQLVQTLQKLNESIAANDPLPPWTNLQAQSNILTSNLQNIVSTLSEHTDLLSSTVVYPLPTYPGRTQESLLLSLIRKKLDPSVEDWVEHGKDIATSAFGPGPDGVNNGLTEAELQELWEWAPVTANVEARRRAWGGDYTLEEKEMGVKNVVTGLRRKLDEGDDSSEEEEDDEEGDSGKDDEDAVAEGEPDEDEMEIVGVRRKSGAAGVEFDVARAGDHPPPVPVSNALPMNDLFRFLSTGTRER